MAKYGNIFYILMRESQVGLSNFCSRFLNVIKHSKVVAAVFKGLRPAVIGMIFSAAYPIGQGIDMSWPTVVIFISVLVLSVKFKVNVAYLIPASCVAGLLLFLSEEVLFFTFLRCVERDYHST